MAGTLVTVATFDNPVDALNSRELLDAQGIRAVVIDAELGAMAESPGLSGLRVQVPAEEATRASELLESLRQATPVVPDVRRAAYASFLCPPAQIYSLWLLARLIPRWRRLSPSDRRLAKVAAAIDLCWLLAVATVVLYFTR